MATATKKSATLPEAKNVGTALDKALNAGKGILRLSPTKDSPVNGTSSTVFRPMSDS
jgi:hypothetical protein